MLARVAFYPTLLYNVVMEKVSSRQWFNRIDDTVILGALPFKGLTNQLTQEENVHGVVTLNEPYEMKYLTNTPEEWRAAGVEQLLLETQDLVAAPTQDKLQRGVDFILRHRAQRHSVYIHCKAGRTRSATVAACYLIQLHGWSPEQAVEELRLKRPHILLRQAQWSAIREFHQALGDQSR